MKQIFEIKDKEVINAVLDHAEYGTLALCSDDIPYSVPVNFVMLGGMVCFHGSHGGRKMKMIHNNPKVSLSIVESYSMIQSYFSSTEQSACPATHFFKSISIEGEAIIVECRDEKAAIMEALMQKLQPEGKYIPMSDSSYDKALGATAVVKIIISDIKAKFKLGQHLDQKRFDMIIEHLRSRGEPKDLETIGMMRDFY